MSNCQFCTNGKCMICQIEQGSDQGVSSMLGRFYISDRARQNRYNVDACARVRKEKKKKAPPARAGRFPYASSG